METWKPSVSVSKVTPTREAKLSNGLDLLTVSEIYEGEFNPINLYLTKRIKFLCSFIESMKNYPFKDQNCSFYIFIDRPDNLATELTHEHLYNEGPEEFGQFVLHWEMSNVTKKLGKGVEVKMNLRRNIQSIFLVTYLPTILMNMINQATSYITAGNKYDVIYMVNITCMMVLASVYLSVSASLPSTANIKPVEIWLLINLAFPVLVILVNVFLQVKIFLEHFLLKKKK